jgi:hypothetical protein
VFRIPLLLVALLGLFVAGCGDDGELGGPGVGGTVAMQVGSFEYTSADLETEVEAWAANPVFLSQVVGIEDIGVEGRRSSELVTYVLSHRVISEIGEQLAPTNGFEVTDADVQQVIAQVDSSFPDQTTGGPLFGAYPEEFREKIGRDFVFQDNLLDPENGVDLDEADVPTVTVNPRYGEYQDLDRGLGQVVSPSGPAPQPGSPVAAGS